MSDANRKFRESALFDCVWNSRSLKSGNYPTLHSGDLRSSPTAELFPLSLTRISIGRRNSNDTHRRNPGSRSPFNGCSESEIYPGGRSDEAAGVPFIAMEFVAGKTLGELIGRKGLRLSETLKYAIQWKRHR